MKQLIQTLFFLLLATVVYAQESTITVRGTVKFPDEKFPILIYYTDGPERIDIDSIPLKNDNSFEKRITLPHPGVYRIDVQKWENLSFWGEDEDITVNFRGSDTARVKIKNPPYEFIENAGPNNQLMNLLNYFNYRSYQTMIQAGQESYRAMKSDSEEWKEYANEGYARNEDNTLADYIFLAKNYSGRNSAVALLPYLRNTPVKDELIARLETTKSGYYPFVQYKKEEKERVEKLSNLQQGMKAPHFSLPAPDGIQKSGPENYKGKYLLIDFWASWCGPCLNTIPHLKEIYSKYNAKGLEILSVSIDDKEDAWKKALAKQQMPWDQVRAPNSGKEIMKDYQFNGIPHLVLLDKEGKIIERWISPEKLEGLLKERLYK
ncbi:TlpA family protein disulfide reductase [Petrimonas sp.]|uniref:TlpA family protein disulfide reductase n=1 Tax=Petrimonas sp. TaxID=2023866 RepID=UPI003F513B15